MPLPAPIPMQLTFKGLDQSGAVEVFVHELHGRLARAGANLGRCDVVIEVPHRYEREGARFHVGIELVADGHELAVSRDPDDFDGHDDVYRALIEAFATAHRRVEELCKVRTVGSRPAAPLAHKPA
jgi:hypothetical protein